MSTQVDPALFPDVADALGISSPAIVEKDYWAIQLLSEVSKISINSHDLVFSGGTCLAKAHQNTYRMSEDLDIIMVPTEQFQCLTNNQQRKERRKIHSQILDLINSSCHFQLISDPEKRSEGQYQNFSIEYPRNTSSIGALRPHLLLEFTESELLEKTIRASIQSLYASALGQDNEIENINCVTVNAIACEKFISLLRRTALFARNRASKDDPVLIRHAYDLVLILSSLNNPEKLKPMVQQVIENDREEFGKKHTEFKKDPNSELLFGLGLLKEDPVYEQRYGSFIGPLVYHPSPVTWKEALTNLKTLAKIWL